MQEMSQVSVSSVQQMSLGRAAWRDILSPDTCFDQGHWIQPSSSCSVLYLLSIVSFVESDSSC